jgi:hypothetical protein
MAETKFTPRFCDDCGSDEAPTLHLDGKRRCRACTPKRFHLAAKLGDHLDLYDALDECWAVVEDALTVGWDRLPADRMETARELGRAALARARGTEAP